MTIQIVDLTELASIAADDYVPVRDTSAGIDKRITPANLIAGVYTAADVLTKLLAVDVDNSGLNATTLQGNAPTAFAGAGHTHGGVLLTDGTVTGATSQAQTFTNGVSTEIVKALDADGIVIKSAASDPRIYIDTESGFLGVKIQPSAVLHLNCPDSNEYILSYHQDSNGANWQNWIEDGGYGGDQGSLYYDFYYDNGAPGTGASGAVVFSPYGRLGINVGYAPVNAGLHIVCGDAVLPGMLIKLHSNSSEAVQLKNSSDTVIFGVGKDGKIKTNQATANTHTPSGATAKQLPVYDTAGTFLGYIPIYGSAW